MGTNNKELKHMTTRMRLKRVKDVYPWLNGCNTIDKLYSKGKDPYMLDIRMEGTATVGAAYMEIDAPDAVFDGTVTPVTVSIISTIADVRTVTVIGWIYDADHVNGKGLSQPDYIGSETITANGAVQADGLKTFKRIFHAYASAGDAVAVIKVIDTASGAITYLTIAAGALILESNGAAIFVPTGMNAGRIDGDAAMTSITNAVTANVNLSEVFTGDSSGDQLKRDVHILTAYNTSQPFCQSLVVMGPEQKMTPSEQGIVSDNTFYWHLPMVMWEA